MLTEQRSYKRKYIQAEKSLIVGNIQNLIGKKDSSSKKAAKQPIKRVRKERHCRYCSKTSYNLRTCTVEIIDLDDSNTSNQYCRLEYVFATYCS